MATKRLGAQDHHLLIKFYRDLNPGVYHNTLGCIFKISRKYKLWKTDENL